MPSMDKFSLSRPDAFISEAVSGWDFCTLSCLGSFLNNLAHEYLCGRANSQTHRCETCGCRLPRYRLPDGSAICPEPLANPCVRISRFRPGYIVRYAQFCSDRCCALAIEYGKVKLP